MRNKFSRGICPFLRDMSKGPLSVRRCPLIPEVSG